MKAVSCPVDFFSWGVVVPDAELVVGWVTPLKGSNPFAAAPLFILLKE